MTLEIFELDTQPKFLQLLGSGNIQNKMAVTDSEGALEAELGRTGDSAAE